MSNGTTKARLGQLLDNDELNGIGYVQVDPVTQTTLYVYFVKDPSADPDLQGQFDATTITITGGDRIPQVRVEPFDSSGNWETDAEGQLRLRLQVAAPGDFSRYTLRIDSELLDSYFDHVVFSFKAGCESDLDCKPGDVQCPPLEQSPVVIDYLAKDYNSFRRALLDFASLRYPRWRERSEADFGMMFMEAMCALADELSYYQDRVAAEAYLETATQRKSVRRHARLIDYRMHEGHAAHAWLVLQVTGDEVEAGKIVKGVTGSGEPVVFEIGKGIHDDSVYTVDEDWNNLQPYYWNDADRCLQHGSTEVFVVGHDLGLEPGKHILIENIPDDPAEKIKRQIVELIALEPGEDVELFDPLFLDENDDPIALTHLRWRQEDALVVDFDLTQTVAVRANLVPATHGVRQPPERFAIQTAPATDPDLPLALERTGPNGSLSLRYALRSGPLTHVAQVVSLGRRLEPPTDEFTGELARAAEPELILREISSAGQPEWEYRRDLLKSRSFDEHFTLDYANDGTATIRFGDGNFGRMPAEETVFQVTYRIGQGTIGNVAPEALTRFSAADLPAVSLVRNPLPAQGGVEPESIGDVRRLAPFAFRELVYRAVRVEDYRSLIERDLPWVSRANAAFRWTGSWLTAFAAADPKESTELTQEQRIDLRNLVDRYRMAGTEAYEVEPAYADLDLQITVCAQPDIFRGNLKERLLEALGSGLTGDGEQGFFHPDQFTFGDPLYRSRLEAVIQAVPGVMGVRRIRVRRRGVIDFPLDELRDNLEEEFEIGHNEVIRMMNDPNRPGQGSLKVYVEGGK